MNYCLRIVIYLLTIGNAGLLSGQQVDLPRRMQSVVPEQEYLYAFGEATKMYLFGNYAQAVNLYNECLKINPTSAAIHYQLSKVYRLAGETALATDHARKASEYDPENKWYLEELATVYQLDHKYDSAILVYTQLLDKEANDLGVVFLLASLYERTGKYKEALNYLSKVEQKVGITKETAVSKYRIYSDMHHEQLALDQLKQALILSNYDYSILGMMAEFFRGNSKPDSAFLYYGKIYPAYKSDPVVVFSFAEFLLEQKRIDSAQFVLLDAMRSMTRYNASVEDFRG
jgi:tetratricopeptide (TPR) repeat protein